METPMCFFAGFDRDGVSRRAYVNVARPGLLSGDDDIEYCRGRIGGSSDKKVPNGSDTDGNWSRRSRIETRLRLISCAYESVASVSSCRLVGSSLDASASFKIPWVAYHQHISQDASSDSNSKFLPSSWLAAPARHKPRARRKRGPGFQSAKQSICRTQW